MTMAPDVTAEAVVEPVQGEPEAQPDVSRETLPESAEGFDSSVDAASAPETESEPDPLASIDPEILLNHPAVRDRVAKEAESARRKAESQTEQRVQAARSEWVQSGRALSEMRQAMENGDDDTASKIMGAVLNSRDWMAVTTIDKIARTKLPADAKVAIEDVNRLDNALRSAQNGSGTLDTYAEMLIEVSAKAYAENIIRPQVEAQVRKEAAARERAAKKVAEAKATEAALESQGRPTLGVPGGAVGQVMLTSAEVDSIPSDQFLRLDHEVQKRLVSQAREADRLYPGRNDRSMVQAVLGR